MQQIIKYQCEICKEKYDTEKEALECEALGRFNSSIYKAGLMFEYHHHNFVGIFAIPFDAKPYDDDTHLGESSWWACRTKGFQGDSLGDKKCGHDFLHSDSKSIEQWIKHNKITKSKVGCDEFKRMVKFLKSKKITPSYYDAQGHLNIVK